MKMLERLLHRTFRWGLLPPSHWHDDDDDDDDSNADHVTDTQLNPSATTNWKPFRWTLEEDAQLTKCSYGTNKRRSAARILV
jgi:hypothetical protein